MRKLTLAASTLALAACASPGIPPGGPADRTAPALLGVSPDSGRTSVKPQAVVFHFDEVVSERPPSAASLDQLFLISPRDGAPSVDWKRKDIAVRPSRGWVANTTYVVTMLPGMADLRGNVRNTGARTFFSTGPALATRTISGKTWNWLAGTPLQSAYVEAVHLPDSVRFAAVADSTGFFQIGHLPQGAFLVRAVDDENRNRGIDPREAWDSVTVTLSDSAKLALYTIPRDSVAPAIAAIAAADSVTVRITFAAPLDPAVLPAPGDISVQAGDSSGVGVRSVTLPAPDTAAAQRLPRPAPPVVILLGLASPLRPGTDYLVTIRRVTSLLGISAPARRSFRTQAANPLSPAPAIK